MKRIIKNTLLMCLVLLTGVLMLTACEELDNMNHVHTEVVDEAVTPTCTEQGLTKGKHCSVCEEILVAQEVIEPFGHKEADLKAVDPTCTETGLTAGKYCSICSEVTVAQQTVAPLGHTEIVDEATDPTCTESGLTEGKHCTVCGAITVDQEIVDALGHTVVVDQAVEPTCTTTGLTAGKHCSVCDYIIVKQETVLPKHTPTPDAPVSPTCTETGLTAGEHCSICNEIITAQTIVPATGHEYGDWVVTVQPTETENGTKRRDCKNCDEYESDIVAVLTHDHSRWDVIILDAVDPTCTETGLTEGKKCAECGETYLAQQTIPAKGHSYTSVTTAPTCADKGYTTHTCSCGESYVDSYINSPGHQVVVDKAVAATCTTSGLTAGEHCSACGQVFVAQETIDAFGHTEVVDPAVAPTCTTVGYTEGTRCSVCKAKIVPQQKISALGHDKVNHDEKAPNCTEHGWYAYSTCTRCDYTTYLQRDALGHVEVADKAVAPTCESTGLTAGSHCSRCNSAVVAQQIVPALGHDYLFRQVSGVSGVYANFCKVCSALKNTEVITYADYGAVGNGVTDDSEAIRKAHNAANYFKLPVEGQAGATYYIGVLETTIVIKTDTNWNGATFIFDDSQIMWNDSTHRSVNVFTVTHDDQYLYYDLPVPTNLKNNGLQKGQTKIDGLNLTGPAMVLVENSNQRIFKRYGVNSDSGDAMQEMLYVDKDGNIIGTPVQYDYSTITKIRIYSVTDDTIEVGNAKIITKVPNPKAQDPSYENNYCFFNRGITVRRSNTILHDIEHIIEGEDMSVIIDRDGDGYTGDSDPDGDGIPEQWGDDKSYGVPYNGFFGFEYSYNVQFKDCKVQGHQAYNFYQTGGRNEMGSYDIYAKYCVDLQILGVEQRENYGAYASETVITNRFMYHGIMGSYYCRNIVMDDCYLDRFDSHKGMHNARITNSTLGFGILVIGGGELYIENVYRISESHFILLREDYNSVFDGDLIIKNCRMGPDVTCIVAGTWRSFDCGLPNYMFRSVTIDGLVVETNGTGINYNIYIFRISNAATSATSDSVNKLYLPTSVTVKNVTKEKVGGYGYSSVKVNTSKNSGDAFSKLTVTKS